MGQPAANPSVNRTRSFGPGRFPRGTGPVEVGGSRASDTPRLRRKGRGVDLIHRLGGLRRTSGLTRKAMVDIVAGASRVAGADRAAESAGAAESWPPPHLPSTFPQPLGKRFAFSTATAAPAAAVVGWS